MVPTLRAIVVTAALAVPAASVAESAKPWEQGTSQTQRDEAHRLFTAGNDRFIKRDYAGALALYEQAIAVFDHRRIRLAMVRTLILLGRPADALGQLERALRWQQAPFDPDEYAEALEHKKTLGRQVATLVIRCTTPGAHLTLDGQD